MGIAHVPGQFGESPRHGKAGGVTPPPEPELHGARALVTGGATRSGMTPDDAPDEVQATWLGPAIMGPPVAWLGPAIMGPPVAWLASRASDGQAGQRIVATEFTAHPAA